MTKTPLRHLYAQAMKNNDDMDVYDDYDDDYDDDDDDGDDDDDRNDEGTNGRDSSPRISSISPPFTPAGK